MFSMKKYVFFVIAILFFATKQTSAAPAVPWPVDYQLPDGTEITIQLRGDERVNWAETPDGFTLLRNSEGFWEYAVIDQSGDLQLSGVRANNTSKRKVNERKLLSTLPKGLNYSESQTESLFEIRNMKNSLPQKLGVDPFVLTGVVRIPVILVGFADKPFTLSKETFEMLLNQPNLTSILGSNVPGSLHDYFSAVSYGQLDLQVDVFGPYTLSGNIRTYASDCPGGRPGTMAGLAVDSAYHRGGADFSNYVIGNSNTVNTIHIIFAGHGTEAGADPCNSIWSHMSYFSPTRNYNGKSISRYSCSPEYRNASGVNITHIGVVAHELGHSLCDWPDFYDVRGRADGPDLGGWCIMASGSWNDGGRTPPFVTAWGRDYVGWTPEIVLSFEQDITLPNPAIADAIYRYNTTTTNEYFLIENRQRTGWDAFIPGSGMLIYHVDRTSLSPWSQNNVMSQNGTSNRRRYYIKQAGGDLASTTPLGWTNPWPQPQLGRTEFTDYSIPNSLSWIGNTTNKPITNIVHNSTERTVFFLFMSSLEYFIMLSQNGAHTFPSASWSYEPQTAHTITISNHGLNPTGILDIVLSGTNADDFLLSKTSASSIAVSGTDNFTVVPKTGLSVGTYTATVTVSGDNGIFRSFNISFVVSRATGSAVTAPEATIVTDSSITVGPVAPPSNGQTVQYAIHTTPNRSASFLAWQNETTFNERMYNTTYYVYARSAQNENFSAGTYAVSSAILTGIPASITNLGINEEFVVYPNPVTNGELKIQTQEWKSGDIVEIFDMSGKRVYMTNLPATVYYLPFAINISHLPNGTLFVRIGNNTVRILKR
jgi:M6 family metalloprotease-like protein